MVVLHRGKCPVRHAAGVAARVPSSLWQGESRRSATRCARSYRLALGATAPLLLGALYAAISQAAAAADVSLWGVFGQPLVELLGRGRFEALWWTRLALVVIALAVLKWRGVRRWPGHLVLVAAGWRC